MAKVNWKGSRALPEGVETNEWEIVFVPKPNVSELSHPWAPTSEPEEPRKQAGNEAETQE